MYLGIRFGKPWDLGPNFGKFRRLSWDFEKILAGSPAKRPLLTSVAILADRVLVVVGVVAVVKLLFEAAIVRV